MISNHETNSQTRPTTKSRFSLRQKLATPLLMAALFTASHVSTVLAQEVAHTASPLAARLGLKGDALTPKAESYDGNPAREGDTSHDFVLSGNATSSTRSTSGASDMVGTTSVQNFQGTQANLSNTHASADGFRSYFTSWYTPNFARRDSAVSVWLFHDFGSYNYDFWNSGGTDLGIDGVRVAWHSGHGGMSSTNNFFAPMGADWSGNGWNARSSNMALGGNYYSYGDERLRYLFWDTCNSVMVSGGNSPYSTWGVRSKGIRMVFGYETTSIDSPNYGKYFWEEWNKGKSLSTAFLDASWRIRTGQSPAVVAFGANQTEATDRLYNERYLSSGAVSNNWGQWRWYSARSAATFSVTNATTTSADGFSLNVVQKPAVSIPATARVRQVAQRSNSNDEVLELSRSLGINLDDPSLIQDRPLGLRAIKTSNATLVVEQNGNFELSLQPTETQATSDGEVADEELINRATDLAGQLSVLKGQEFRVDMIRDTKESGGFEGFTDAVRTVEKTIIIDQLIDGVPFVDPEAGHLEVTFDARSGQTTRVRSSLRQIAPASDDQTITIDLTIEQARKSAIRHFAAQSGRVNATQAPEVVTDSEAVGYQMIDGQAVPVYSTLVKDPRFELSRPQLSIVPLIKKN